MLRVTINSFDATIDLFDGQTLTITVEYDDGSYSTQVVELHAADMRAKRGSPIGNGQDLTVLPEIMDSPVSDVIDFSTLSDEEIESMLYIHSLYGVIAETNNRPFPYSLENANSRALIVDAPYTLPAMR